MKMCTYNRSGHLLYLKRFCAIILDQNLEFSYSR